ncbi:MAG TPA: hypothetical protein PK637_04315, partial [Flavobacteriales bacterium]|nr:hypothetical protein [Flavobacteriales bacterium]
ISCLWQSGCSLKADVRAPILQCEEFSLAEPFPPKIKEHSLHIFSAPKHSGICSTCDKNHNCALRKENEIKIHCEHYQ